MAADDPTALVPFTVDIPEGALLDLRDRLARTRWPEREAVDDWSQGIPLAYVQDLCRYWAESYDWRRCEARINSHPQVTTVLDGLRIHLLHVRSPHEEAVPLVLTHGWPGSIVEFLDVIGPLTDPTAHGGDAADAFHVVVPSLPGYGFSDKPTEKGWGVPRIAAAWSTLMARLGYDRYGAQGGDWGAAVTTAIAQHDPEHCMGIHLNMVLAAPEQADFAQLTEEEGKALAHAAEHQRWGLGYSTQQSTRPQTLGYGLVDSPAAQAAWIVEKLWAWTDNDGLPDDAVARDTILDNVMLYWLTASGASSARLYWESFNDIAGSGAITVPMGASMFPAEIFTPSRRWAERRYADIRHWGVLERGGHFAAMEEPDLFVDEVRTFFRTVR